MKIGSLAFALFAVVPSYMMMGGLAESVRGGGLAQRNKEGDDPVDSKMKPFFGNLTNGHLVDTMVSAFNFTTSTDYHTDRSRRLQTLEDIQNQVEAIYATQLRATMISRIDEQKPFSLAGLVEDRQTVQLTDDCTADDVKIKVIFGKVKRLKRAAKRATIAPTVTLTPKSPTSFSGTLTNIFTATTDILVNVRAVVNGGRRDCGMRVRQIQGAEVIVSNVVVNESIEIVDLSFDPVTSAITNFQLSADFPTVTSDNSLDIAFDPPVVFDLAAFLDAQFDIDAAIDDFVVRDILQCACAQD